MGSIVWLQLFPVHLVGTYFEQRNLEISKSQKNYIMEPQAWQKWNLSASIHLRNLGNLGNLAMGTWLGHIQQRKRNKRTVFIPVAEIWNEWNSRHHRDTREFFFTKHNHDLHFAKLKLWIMILVRPSLNKNMSKKFMWLDESEVYCNVFFFRAYISKHNHFEQNHPYLHLPQLWPSKVILHV